MNSRLVSKSNCIRSHQPRPAPAYRNRWAAVRGHQATASGACLALTQSHQNTGGAALERRFARRRRVVNVHSYLGWEVSVKIVLSAVLVFATTLACTAAERLLMTRLGPSQSSLFVSNAVGSSEQRLTEGYLDYNPAWSPDGQWIVFTSERNGSADLYRMRPDGSGLERLTDDPAYEDQAAFSPDGNRIAFVTTRADGRANLWILDLNTRQATPLTSGAGGDFRPAWSPDGQCIAFSSDRGSSMEFAKGRWEHLHFVDIYLIRPDGSELKRLSHGDFCGSPKWSGDGASVVVYCMPAEDTWTFRVALRRGGLPEVGETTLTRIDIATNEAKPVSAGPGVKMFPSILPSGEIAFLRADMQAQGVFYATGKPGPAGDVRWPAWSPDGKRVVYGRETSPPPGAPRKLWSKNPQYELFSTGILPAYDRSGERYVATAIAPNRRDTTLILGAGDGRRSHSWRAKTNSSSRRSGLRLAMRSSSELESSPRFSILPSERKSQSIRLTAAHRSRPLTPMDQAFARSHRVQTT